MFVDASAWTAILLNEPERDAFKVKLADADVVLSSPIANWETVRAVARETQRSATDVATVVAALQAAYSVRQVEVSESEQRFALEAHARFGKGVHPAKLNMGDCFAYACARTNGVPLLYTGDGFALTDIESA